MQNETWLADAIEDFLRDTAKAGLKDWATLTSEVNTDVLESMVEDMFIAERAEIAEAIERDYNLDIELPD